MDRSHFDDLTRSLTDTRRALFGGIVMAAAGWLGVAGGEAKKKRRRKRRKNKPRFNPFGCVDVGGKCFGNDGHCCSGICEGSGKSSTCVAHNELDCSAGADTCAAFVSCGVDGDCYRTTGKAGFCAANGICDCRPCQKDTDCEAEFGAGAACIVCIGDCDGVNGSQGTACVPAAT